MPFQFVNTQIACLHYKIVASEIISPRFIAGAVNWKVATAAADRGNTWVYAADENLDLRCLVSQHLHIRLSSPSVASACWCT